MINRWTFYTAIIVIVGFISTAFKPKIPQNHQWFLKNETSVLQYQLPSEKESDYKSRLLPYTGKYFIGFKEAIACRESRGQYDLVNSLGYLGKYQFGTSALRSVGITNNQQFLNNPELQEKAFVALIKINKWQLRDLIKIYSGKVIDGVTITESGILASAHLGGAGSVRKFLESKGRRKIKDNYGTSVKSYMRDFAGFETQNLKASGKAKV
ncbi:MAG: peptidoglycan-binding protein LysM [Flavobacterium sp.]|nr:peptidoglycan-binding protein LysM [Flavobacterium sp.]